jgi:putative glycerol-1-phosphate prenyltransferase
MSTLSLITDKANSSQKQFAVLIDPDKVSLTEVEEISKISAKANVDLIFVGGSLLTKGSLDECIQVIKKHFDKKVIIFPGNSMQISSFADGILLLSLISGRNADMLIGKHVIAAPFLKASKIEIIPSGYLIIESGVTTAAQYMSNTQPIPFEKDDIAMCTAMAGEMLGLKLIYLDAGSGAKNHVSETMIKKVKSNISVPLIIGGGIKTPEIAKKCCLAGADIIVVGNAIEKNFNLISSISEAIHSIQ